MKKLIAILLLLALFASCATLVGCTDGEEEETGHNIIVGGEENEDENDDSPADKEQGTVTDEWELGGVPLG